MRTSGWKQENCTDFWSIQVEIFLDRRQRPQALSSPIASGPSPRMHCAWYASRVKNAWSWEKTKRSCSKCRGEGRSALLYRSCESVVVCRYILNPNRSAVRIRRNKSFVSVTTCLIYYGFVMLSLQVFQQVLGRALRGSRTNGAHCESLTI